VRWGELTEQRARQAREDFAGLQITRYPHGHLLDRAWDLRENVTAHDGMFVVLAEVLGVPLVTVDGRLAASTGHGATIV
jgi:predicted nucleic acid-binding protein